MRNALETMRKDDEQVRAVNTNKSDDTAENKLPAFDQTCVSQISIHFWNMRNDSLTDATQAKKVLRNRAQVHADISHLHNDAGNMV